MKKSKKLFWKHVLHRLDQTHFTSGPVCSVFQYNPVCFPWIHHLNTSLDFFIKQAFPRWCTNIFGKCKHPFPARLEVKENEEGVLFVKLFCCHLTYFFIFYPPTLFAFSPSRMVLSAAGGVDHDKLVDLAKEFFGTSVAQDQSPTAAAFPPCTFTGSDVRS